MVDGNQEQWADPAFLRGDQYRSQANLCARQSIYAYQQPRVDLPSAVMELAVRTGDEVVADVGCGNGAYVAELSRRGHRGLVAGVDLSVGMLEAARRATPRALFAVGDASALPIRTGAVDLALAMHMLYHVRDPAKAVAELRRVLAPEGRLVVVLNAQDHLGELRHAVQQARDDNGLGGSPFGERLRLAEGHAMLGAAFTSVVRHDFVSELVLSRPGPLEAYVRSMIDTALLPESQREGYVARVLGHLPWDRTGTVKIRTHPGCLVCS
ncbi:MAG TPA: class I SAM-dependent methyltransferase [Acidimicrobiales bacterium]|nr:class I SAM-dependent methyltransferase [Acidimicrobiales bacterium]